MMAVLGFIAVACIAIVAFVIGTASSIGAFEVIMIALFGFGAIVAMIIFSVSVIGKYTGRKVKKGVVNIKSSIKKLKKS